MKKSVADWCHVWNALVGRPAQGDIPELKGFLVQDLPGILGTRFARLRRAMEAAWLPKMMTFEKERQEINTKADLTPEQRAIEIEALSPLIFEEVEIPFVPIPLEALGTVQQTVHQREALLEFFGD